MFPYFKQRELRTKERFHQSRRIFFESVILGIASPQQIRRWAQRQLPNGSVVGEVLFGKTVDYKTLKPIRDGLFCERIFGPTKDFYCACGKRQPNDGVSFCPECEVEYYPATIRRHRLGYIELVSGVVHIWYFKGRPNYLSILLHKKRKSLEALIYCTTVLGSIHTLDLMPITSPVRALSVPGPGGLSPNEAALEDSSLSPTRRGYARYQARRNLIFPNSVFGERRPCTPPREPNTCYRSGHAIPISTTFTCDVFGQNNLIQYWASFPEEGDEPIPHYANPNLLAGPEQGDKDEGRASFQDLLREYDDEQNATMRRILHALGGQAVVNMITRFDLRELCRLIAVEIAEITPYIEFIADFPVLLPTVMRVFRKLIFKRMAYIRRFKLLHTFLQTKRDPSWMVLFAVPVLPPTLRPIAMMDNGIIFSSDMNRLYQRVLHRNSRMARSRVLDTETVGFHQRLVQEAVDAVLENGKGGSPLAVGLDNRPLKSLSERLKGKRGRFRFNLLGKRVDYSGRSVIVVGPKLRLHECGVPREIAIQLFSPFLIRRLLELKSVNSFLRAKLYIQTEHPIIWSILLDIMGQYPILLNRAPTLHRLGIQAFQPRLVSTQAILLHPLVCTAFNADFDGDQMALHVPLSFHARAEAWKLLWSRNNLLAPATGDPILAPSQDMILGSFYLTTSGEPDLQKRAMLEVAPADRATGIASSEDVYFADAEDALQAFSNQRIRVRTPIWLRLPLTQTNQNGDKPKAPEELQIHADGLGFALFIDLHQRRQWSFSTNEGDFLTAYATILSQFVQTTAGRVLVNHVMTSPDPTTSKQLRRHMKRMLKTIFAEFQRQADDVQRVEELRDLFQPKSKAALELEPLSNLLRLRRLQQTQTPGWQDPFAPFFIKK